MTKTSYLPEQGPITIQAATVFTAHSSQLSLGSPSHRWRPPTDVTETETHIVVMVEVAGMEDGELNITLKGTHLAVSGIRARHSGIRAFHQMEISYGEFFTDAKLPARVESQGVEAHYADGFLTVRLPKQRMPIIELE